MAEKNRVYEIAKAHGLASKDLLAVLQPYSCLPRRVLRELLGPAAS